MTTPNDVQNQINAVPWTNNRGLVTGATVFTLLTAIVGLFALYSPSTVTLPHVANNAALQAVIPTAAGQVYVRDGFYAAGDGGGATYTSAAGACSAADNGAQVQPTGAAYCWTVQAQTQMDLRVWPVTANNAAVDSGPAIRAAAGYSALAGVEILVPAVAYYVNTLDSTGLGGIVAGARPLTTTSASAVSGATTIQLTNITGITTGSHFGVQLTDGTVYNNVVQSVSANTVTLAATPGAISNGAAVWSYAANGNVDKTFKFIGPTLIANQTECAVSAPYIKLGPGLNRPLLYIEPQVANPLSQGVCWDGNRANQTGYAAGPNGELFAIDAASSSDLAFESSLTFNYSVITGGYNGSFHLGASRGVFWSTNAWFMYSGKAVTDVTTLWQGYDATLMNPQIGPNTGTAGTFSQGSQYQIVGGAIFENWSGISIFGDYVTYINVTGTNIQANYCGGLSDSSAAPGTSNPIGHNFTNVTFDENSVSGAGVCSAINSGGSSHLTLVSPQFGSTAGTTGVPQYAINTGGVGLVAVVAPRLAANAYTAAFTDSPANVFCTGCTAAAGTSAFTVATLPSSPPEGIGARRYVTDQLTACPAAGSALTGGGAVTCFTAWNGSGWVRD